MRAVIVGAGHNGLVCACYLARAGHDVLVLEQAASAGGGSRTEESVPGFRFDTHSAAHNIINMTPIPAELELAGAGLRYVEMDPFAVAVFGDGRRVRFHRSLERTVASIAEHDAGEARAYAAFVERATPLVDLAVARIRWGGGVREGADLAVRSAPRLLRVLRRGPRAVAAELLAPYRRVLESQLPSDLTRAPVAAFAAHAGAGPDMVGGAFFALWQAAYHRHGQWHAVGGAQALVDALTRRLHSLGGALRCGAAVRRIDAPGGVVRGVELDGGERIAADAVVTAMHPRTALLELLQPPLGGAEGARVGAAHTSNGVQAVLHIATDRLPPYPGAEPEDHAGLQSYVDTLDQLATGFRAAEDRRLALPAPAYAFTPSALDGSLAPPGCHTVYLACPSAPFEVRRGWSEAAPRLIEDVLDQVERRAPGFRASIRSVTLRDPEAMAAELRWPGAHPMYVDVTLDQLAGLRPTPGLAGHRTPVQGLYVSGAGTAPAGGVAGAPGRAAAHAVLADLKRARRARAARRAAAAAGRS